MTDAVSKQRTATSAAANPLGVAGIEYVEYATHEPQSFGAALEKLGFVAVARHRSREIVLYRAGGMNVIVNADPAVAGVAGGDDDEPQTPRLKAFALRVRDAAAAYEHCVEKGAWPIVPRVGAMELNIPGISGSVTASSISSIAIRNFRSTTLISRSCRQRPKRTRRSPACTSSASCSPSRKAVPASGWTSTASCSAFCGAARGQYFGVLPKGTLLESPCLQFYLQLVEPPEQAAVLAWQEKLTRVGFGAPDITALVSQLRARGVNFVESDSVHTSDRGAVTYLGGTSFEFVKSHLPATE